MYRPSNEALAVPASSGRRAGKRRLSALVALVLSAALATVVVPTGAADAEVPPPIPGASKYYRSLTETSHPDWMRWVTDNTSLGNISMPGTHDTLAIQGGTMIQTQEHHGVSGATLTTQFQAGIRAIDIRVRLSERPTDTTNGVFTVHHGSEYMDAVFGDVLRESGRFLDAHPDETILLNLKMECTGGGIGRCDDVGGATDADRLKTFQQYRDNADGRYFWWPSVSSEAAMPTLGQVRGKIVLQQFRNNDGFPYGGYGLDQIVKDNGFGAAQHYTQDMYNLPDWSWMDDKRDKISEHFVRTNQDADPNKMYVNFTSGAGTASEPYKIAGGTETNTGMNRHTIDYLLDAKAKRTGVVFMDFPGAGLIDSIIAHNYKGPLWSSNLAADIHQTYKNIAYQTYDDAETRQNRLARFFPHVAPQVDWVVAVIKQNYGFQLDTGDYTGMADILHDNYRYVVYPVAKGSSTNVTVDQIKAVMTDSTISGLSGSLNERAATLRQMLVAAHPGPRWSVVVKEDPGGYQNWKVSWPHPGTANYTTAHGGIRYLAYAIGGSASNVPSLDFSGVDNLDWDESGADAGVPGERVAYFNSWSIYANNYTLKTVDTNGTAAKLTKLNYAFENIHPTDLTCMAANKASSNDESSSDGNDGSGDAWADYQKGFTAEESIDGVADTWTQPLKGNFNQLKKLKAKYPHLKALVSIGGWTYSKYFSDVAATAASRQKFVKSCVDMYIKGNLPKIGDDPAGGDGVAAGVFDGIDIDWEFPGSADGHTGNHYGAQDTANFTALLAEFRSQLNAAGGGYQLTAALPAGANKINKLQVSQIASYLDLGNIMTYDMHGGWESNGPTNSQDPLYSASDDPSTVAGMTVDDAITAYLDGGFPAGKLALGVPFYARGWTGVPDGGAHGRYQSVTGPTASFEYSQQPGVAHYKELVAADKMVDGKVFWDQQAKSTWVYDGTNYWGVSTPKSLTARRQYIKGKGLGGVMIYSLEADAPGTTLLKAATGMN